MKKLIILISGLLIFAGTRNCLQAQSEGLAAKISAARQANAALMKQYSWQSRTEVIDNGKVADIRIDTVAYGPNGQLQRTLLNDDASALPRGFLRRRIAERERERVEKFLTGLRSLLDQYTLATQGKVFEFVLDAKISAPDANGLLQLTGSSVVVPGDTYTLWVQIPTQQTRKATITTTFDGDPVTLTASFKTLPSGLTHVEFAELAVPAKQISLQVHNYNYNQNN